MAGSVVSQSAASVEISRGIEACLGSAPADVLMLYLRLLPLELLLGLPSSFWPKPCKRLRPDAHGQKRRLSTNTGSYNEARQGLPVSVVEQCSDRAFLQLTEEMMGTIPAVGQRAFLIDGTTTRTAHTEALCTAYPVSSNQHGETHWPL